MPLLLICWLINPDRVTAVQAVTCSHPSIIERAASGNASGRCILWAPPEDFEQQDADEDVTEDGDPL